MALRERVVAFVEEGHSHRAAGARFRVSVKFVNDMVILKRKTGRLDPRAQGNGGGHGKLASLRGWIEARMVAKPDLTLNDLVLELADRHSITIHHYDPPRLGLARPAQPRPDTQKKTSKPPNRSGLRSGRLAISGSHDVSLSCVTCCRA